MLFEHASGYGLFRVKEFEEVATFIPEVERSTSDVSKFQSIVKLSAFAPFKSGTNALDNMNSISEGQCYIDQKKGKFFILVLNVWFAAYPLNSFC